MNSILSHLFFPATFLLIVVFSLVAGTARAEEAGDYWWIWGHPKTTIFVSPLQRSDVPVEASLYNVAVGAGSGPDPRPYYGPYNTFFLYPYPLDHPLYPYNGIYYGSNGVYWSPNGPYIHPFNVSYTRNTNPYPIPISFNVEVPGPYRPSDDWPPTNWGWNWPGLVHTFYFVDSFPPAPRWNTFPPTFTQHDFAYLTRNAPTVPNGSNYWSAKADLGRMSVGRHSVTFLTAWAIPRELFVSGGEGGADLVLQTGVSDVYVAGIQTRTFDVCDPRYFTSPSCSYSNSEYTCYGSISCGGSCDANIYCSCNGSSYETRTISCGAGAVGSIYQSRSKSSYPSCSWGGWNTTGSSCACESPTVQTDTGSCPIGYSGSITYARNKSSYPSCSWGGWYEYSRNCSINQYTLTTTVTGNGTVSGTGGYLVNSGGGTVSGTGTYNYGTYVSLTATAGPGWSFAGWSGAGCGSSVYIDGNKSCTAIFTLNQHTLTTTVTGNGTVSGTGGLLVNSGGGTVSGTGTYNYGTYVSLTATAGPGWSFAGWSGSGCGSSTYIDGDKSCTATFTLNAYTLSVNKSGDGSGSISSSPTGISCGSTCSKSYTHGTDVTLTASANVGSTFKGWSGGGCSGTDPCTVAMTDTATVNARFTLNDYDLTTDFSSGGTISGRLNSPTITSHKYSTTIPITLSASPSTGYHFVEWTGDCSGTDSIFSVYMTDHRSCVANFEINRYTLSTATDGNGSGSVSGAGTYTHGSDATLTATADTDSTFTGWSGNCSGSSSSFELTNITSNKSCTATFINDRPQIDTVTITDSVGNNVTATNKANPTSDTPIQYTINVSGSDTGGAGEIVAARALINYQGSHAGERRGQLIWWNTGPDPFWSGVTSDTQDCNIGKAAFLDDAAGNDGSAHLDLRSCSVSDSGDIRTVTFAINFRPSFTSPLTDNDISGFVYDDINQYDTRGGLGIVNGWRNFDTNFAIVPPLSATCSADSSHTYSPTTSYTADTFTWKVRSAGGGTGIYDYSWSGAEGPTGSGSALTPTTLSSANAVVNGYASSGDKTATLALSSAGGTKSFSCASVTANPIPDLIPDDGTLPSYTLSSGTAPMAGESLTFSARVANKGPKATGSANNFRNVIQIRNSKNNGTEAGDTTVARVDTGLITSLNVGAGTNVSAPYTFSDTTLINHGTTFFYRVCANMKDDGTPSITAEVGGNNCGADGRIVVHRSIQASCKASPCDDANASVCSGYTTSDLFTWRITALRGGNGSYSYRWEGGPITTGTHNDLLPGPTQKSGTLTAPAPPDSNSPHPPVASSQLETALVEKRYRVPSNPDNPNTFKTGRIIITSNGVEKSFNCSNKANVRGIADLVPGETG